MLGATDRIIYPYIIPMLLGRTFDIFKAHVGVDIFTQDSIRTPIRIHRSFVNSDFRLIRNDTEAKSFLGIQEDVSLRVKAGVLDIGTFGEYIKDIQTRDNYVEILVKSTYETFSETLHGTVSPIKDWELLNPNSLGTHYVRSVSYGGVMLASLRLYASDNYEKQKMENFLTSNYNFSEVSVTVEKTPEELHYRREMSSFEEKLEKLMYDVKKKNGSDLSVRIKYYSTVNAPRVPQDIPSFLSILEDFPAAASKINGGLGVPLTVELVPLRELSPRKVTPRANRFIGKSLVDLENRLNDLLLTHGRIQGLSSHPIDDYNKQSKVRDLGTEVHDKMDMFNQVIQKLDLASPESRDLSERAIQAYEQRPGRKSYFERFKNIEKGDESPARAPLSRGGVTSLQEILEQFASMSELAMANGICAALNQFSGSFITMKRNCSLNDSEPMQCSRICNQIQVGTNHTERAECIGVVAAQLQTPTTLGATQGKGYVGAQTANLGRSTCDRTICYKEFCCCRLTKYGNV